MHIYISFLAKKGDLSGGEGATLLRFSANGRRAGALVGAQGTDDEGKDLATAGKGCR
jgi:hypothetical protein